MGQGEGGEGEDGREGVRAHLPGAGVLLVVELPHGPMGTTHG